MLQEVGGIEIAAMAGAYMYAKQVSTSSFIKMKKGAGMQFLRYYATKGRLFYTACGSHWPLMSLYQI